MSRLATAVTILVLVFASGCGVPRDSSPQAIELNRLPADLIEAQVPVTIPDLAATNVQIWMVGPENLLTTVGREVPHTPEAVMASLLLGTTPEEKAQGITSAITRDVQGTVSLDEAEDTAYVDLTEGSLRSSARSEQTLAVGQIVYSLTGLTTVQRVVFSIAGQPVSIPSDAGATVAGVPVTKRDFQSLTRQPLVGFVATADDTTDPTPTATPTPPVIGSGVNPTDLSIWMVTDDGLLIPVVRRIERTPQALMASLLLGPEIQERASGIQSAILPSAFAISVTVTEPPSAPGTAVIDLAEGSLPPVTDPARLRAVGQIVYTVTGVFEVESVFISINGVPQPMPTERGVADATMPLTRAEYASLAPNVALLTPSEPTAVPTPG